jgi:hypothetical protein
MVKGETAPITQETDHAPVLLAETTQADFAKRRDYWQFILVWSSLSGTVRTWNYRIGEYTDAPTANFFETATTMTITSQESGLVIGSDPLPTDTQLRFGGFPLVGAIPANTEYGGCGEIRHVTLMLNYLPNDITDPNILMNHMFEFSNNLPSKIANYIFRIKNFDVLDVVAECDIPSSLVLSFKATNNEFMQKGLPLGYGDYLDCVNSKLTPTGDLVLSFKFYFTEAPSADFNLVSMLYKHIKNFQQSATNEINGRLPVYFHFVKFGVFLTPARQLKIIHMGLARVVTGVLTIDTGYTVSVVLKKHEDPFLTGPLLNRRFITVYVNGVKIESFTMLADLGVFKDSSNSAKEKNNYFYVGDFLINSLNRYNYIFLNANPLNSFGTYSTTERGFSTPIIFLHDLTVFEDASLTKEVNLLTPNCLLGLPGTLECLVCQTNYALTITNTCTLKTSLPSFSIYLTKFDALVECGTGLFYNDFLGICQICTTDCAVCTSATNCLVKKQGCGVTNCATCTPALVCLTCNAGYALNTGTNACLACLILNCNSCPVGTLTTCTACNSGFFFNTGSNLCDPCDPVAFLLPRAV